jgi:hypothetical protein
MINFLDFKLKHTSSINIKEEDFSILSEIFKELENSIIVIYSNNNLFSNRIYSYIVSMKLDPLSIRLSNYIGYKSNRIFFLSSYGTLNLQLERFEITYEDSIIKYIITDNLNILTKYKQISLNKNGIDLNNDFKKYIRYKKSEKILN